MGDKECLHASSVGVSESEEILYPGQIGLTGSQVRCTGGCDRVFPSLYDLMVDKGVIAASD